MNNNNNKSNNLTQGTAGSSNNTYNTRLSTDNTAVMENSNSSIVQHADSPERRHPRSPYWECSICLGNFVNPSRPNTCNTHTFCFECLKRWTMNKTREHVVCPLCLRVFSSIYHSFTSINSHSTYVIPTYVPFANPNELATINDESNSNFLLLYERATRQNYEFFRPSNTNRVNNIIRTRIIDRTQVYLMNLWAVRIDNSSIRPMDNNRYTGIRLDELRIFITREFGTLMNLPPNMISFMQIYSISIRNLILLINRLIRLLNENISEESFSEVLRIYFENLSDHVSHEIINFALSYYSVGEYDNLVNYQIRDTNHNMRIHELLWHPRDGQRRFTQFRFDRPDLTVSPEIIVVSESDDEATLYSNDINDVVLVGSDDVDNASRNNVELNIEHSSLSDDAINSDITNNVQLNIETSPLSDDDINIVGGNDDDNLDVDNDDVNNDNVDNDNVDVHNDNDNVDASYPENYPNENSFIRNCHCRYRHSRNCSRRTRISPYCLIHRR